MFDNMLPQWKRRTIEVIGGLVVAVPVALVLAIVDPANHGFLQTFLVATIAVWFMASAVIYFVFFTYRIRRSLRNATAENFSPSDDMPAFRNRYQVLAFVLVLAAFLFIAFFPSDILGIPANIAIFLIIIGTAGFILRKGRSDR